MESSVLVALLKLLFGSISEIAENFGSQCVVVAIQARKDPVSKSWTCMYENAKEKSDLVVDEWIKKVQELVFMMNNLT